MPVPFERLVAGPSEIPLKNPTHSVRLMPRRYIELSPEVEEELRKLG